MKTKQTTFGEVEQGVEYFYREPRASKFDEGVWQIIGHRYIKTHVPSTGRDYEHRVGHTALRLRGKNTVVWTWDFEDGEDG
jgi:hypothetical protein